MGKPMFIYDGSCEFCMRWVKRLQKATGNKLDFVPYQELTVQFPQIPEVEYKTAIHLVEPDGTVSRAAHAAFRALALNKWWGWTLLLYRYLPGFALISECVYRFIAKRRSTSCSNHM